MRAREFLKEQATLPPEDADPMRYTYILPGVSAADPYQTYRLGVALARARSDVGEDDHNINPFKPEWSAQSVFGDHAVVAGFNNTVDPVIDKALSMTKTPGGKKLISTPQSSEPKFVEKISPIRAFKGYPR
jgi:hypothetical protein